MAADEIHVEVVYARAGEQIVIELCVPRGATVGVAVESSHIAERCPELLAAPAALGIYGKVVAPDTLLQPGDRVEIYRPLIADPKQVRRRRAAENR